MKYIMKIERFNENTTEATNKMLKVKVSAEFEVSVEDIEKMNNFSRHFYNVYKDNPNLNKYDVRKDAFYYGIEDYIYSRGNLEISYDLVDGLGNRIEDEEKFDEYQENVKKYNL